MVAPLPCLLLVPLEQMICAVELVACLCRCGSAPCAPGAVRRHAHAHAG